MVDDQPAHYTVALLSTIKRDHERWIAGLGDARNRPRLVPDPTRPAAESLRIATSGSVLWDIASGSDAMRPSWPSGLSEDQHDLIAEFLDDLRDWGDVHSLEGSYQAGRDAAKVLNTHVENLNEAGLLVSARIRHLLLTGDGQAPMPWRELDIQIRPLTPASDVGESALLAKPLIVRLAPGFNGSEGCLDQVREVLSGRSGHEPGLSRIAGETPNRAGRPR